jgi:hypothetical protein
MVFVGDSDADYCSARQLNVKFVENRFNAEFYQRATLIKEPNPGLNGYIARGRTNQLTQVLSVINDAM